MLLTLPSLHARAAADDSLQQSAGARPWGARCQARFEAARTALVAFGEATLTFAPPQARHGFGELSLTAAVKPIIEACVADVLPLEADASFDWTTACAAELERAFSELYGRNRCLRPRAPLSVTT